MPFCIICKEITDRRYPIKACDKVIDLCVDGHLCRHCYNKLHESKNDSGFFKLARLTSWSRHRRDSMREL